eukprot:270899-Rhodomonas_salina.1
MGRREREDNTDVKRMQLKKSGAREMRGSCGATKAGARQVRARVIASMSFFLVCIQCTRVGAIPRW